MNDRLSAVVLFLTFAPLRGAAGGFEAELFALLRSRIAFEKSADLEIFALFRHKLGDNAGDTVAYRFGLRFVTAAVDMDRNGVRGSKDPKRRESRLYHLFERKVVGRIFTVDRHRRGFCVGETDTCARCFAAADCFCVHFIFCHTLFCDREIF